MNGSELRKIQLIDTLLQYDKLKICGSMGILFLKSLESKVMEKASTMIQNL